jgi:hypothetical protein
VQIARRRPRQCRLQRCSPVGFLSAVEEGR